MKKKDLFVPLVLLIALVFSGCAAPGVAEAVNDPGEVREAPTSTVLASSAFILTPEFWINDVTYDEFIKGLRIGVGRGFMVRSTAVPTLLPPATWKVDVLSIIDTIIPGRLETLTCNIYEKDKAGHVEVAIDSVKARYNPLSANQPNGRVLFIAMKLYLAQSGVKSFTEDDVLALMTKIKMGTVAVDGKKFTFGCPQGIKWVAYEENGQVVLKKIL